MAEINATISKKTPQLEASLPGTLQVGVPGPPGPEGPPGDPGKSAYQYAIEGGYIGTEEEFSKKLVAAASVDDVLAALPTWTGGSY